jgi:hypothetical protein
MLLKRLALLCGLLNIGLVSQKIRLVQIGVVATAAAAAIGRWLPLNPDC